MSRPRAPWRRRARTGLLLLLAAPCGSAGAQLTIRLPARPAATPPDALIYVAGSFNGWRPDDSASRLVRGPDGTESLTLPADARGAVEFKLTLGSWARGETTGGRPSPNRRVVVPPQGALTVDVAVDGWGDGRPAAPPRSTATRGVHIVSDSFPISSLGRTRRVWIYLPPGYARSRRRYPVLYLQDGQNTMDAATAFAGEWGVDESLDSLARARGTGLIVVAVDHGGARRLDEYDPWANREPRLGGGEGDAYVDFLVHALKPYVDRHYRTRPDARHTAVMGSSAGALIAFYAALRHPSTYGAAMLFSPAFWLAGDSLNAFVSRVPAGGPRPRLYMVSGAMETPEGQPATDQHRMAALLRARGFPPGGRLVDEARAEGKHAEWFWRSEFPGAVRWFLDGAR